MVGEVSKITEKLAKNAIGTLIYVDVDAIDDSNRLRPSDPVAAEAMAATFAREGQLTPIDVCRLPGQTQHTLVYGGRRLDAAKLLGWKQIAAFERSANALDRKAREIVENLFRDDLSPIDRATFVAELYSVEKARAGVTDDGRAVSANIRWQKVVKEQASDASAKIALAYGFADTVADKLGMSRRSIYNDLTLFRRLSPTVTEKVRGLPIGSNASALRALAKMEPADQAKAVGLIAGGKVKTVAEAIAIIRETPAETKAEKRIQNIVGVFARLSAADRAECLRLMSAHLPMGWKIAQIKTREKLPTNSELAAMVEAADGGPA